MSFTQDELQSLNAIFDQKISILRRDLERSLDQRLQHFKRESDQRQTTNFQDLLRSQLRRFNEQQHRSRDLIFRRIDHLQEVITQNILSHLEQKEQHQISQIEDAVGRALAAQLLGIEQLIHQRIPSRPLEDSSPISYFNQNDTHPFGAIEVQTEIPWDELVDLVDRILIQRLDSLQVTLIAEIKKVEQSLLNYLEYSHNREVSISQSNTAQDPRLPSSERVLPDWQDITYSIDQLRRLVESMQVAMTANSALLSNRLYHHEHLPVERAHPHSHQQSPLTSELNSHKEISPTLFQQQHSEEQA